MDIMRMVGWVVKLQVQRNARRHGLSGLTRQLEENCAPIAQRIAAGPDLPHNRWLANHIIGIERWGQRRLRVMLGESLLQDEYDGYQPGQEQSLAALAAAFQATRAETVAVLREIAAAPGQDEQRVPHNDLGELTPAEWAAYLEEHSRFESRKMKG